MEKQGIDLASCVGQGYNNASVMSGGHSGVQKRIKDNYPKAEFVPCSNHCLNLVGVHAAKVTSQSVTFFGTVEKVYSYFSQSTKRWAVLLTFIPHGVKRVADTRWSSYNDAVSVVADHYLDICECLEQLSESDSDAGILLSAMSSYIFLCYLFFWSPILVEINVVQKYLQRSSLTLDEAVSKLKSFNLFLEENCETLVSKALNEAGKVASENDVHIPRTRRRKRRCDEVGDEVGLTFEEDVRRQLIECFDRLKAEFSHRFKCHRDLQERFNFLRRSAILSEAVTKINLNALEIYKEEINLEQIPDEVRRLKRFLQSFETLSCECDDTTLGLLSFVCLNNLEDSVPNLFVLLRICLTVCISNATCERSFSKLKLIKSHLRATMTQRRLNDLSLISVEGSVLKKVDLRKCIDVFARSKARRVRI